MRDGLTSVGSGVAQIFHELLVELRLLLVAEVEEGEKEDRQEEGEEVEGVREVWTSLASLLPLAE